ncbi:HNH endonuclease [Glaciihabitans arcticus]|nr:HNH endonuclease signature motif containing protein [Glaciihabitans arcticus]
MNIRTLTLPAAFNEAIGALVDEAFAIARAEAGLAARKALVLAEARRLSVLSSSLITPAPHGWSAAETARRVLVSEVVCALRLPERTAETLIADSDALVNALPSTFDAVSRGTMSWRHAHLVVDHASSLPSSSLPEFESRVVPLAEHNTAAQFNRKARIVRERMHPETIDSRQSTATEQRAIDLQPARDGMAYLTAFLPAVTAHAIFNRLDGAARAARAAGDTRTVTQLRADSFAGALLGTESPSPELLEILATIRPSVQVTVPVLTLLGRSDAPASLDGYGPIDLETAMKLTGNAPSLTRLLTHPETGSVLSVGRDRYRVPSDLRQMLRTRDGTCRFVGCNRQARGCDIDHTDEWQHGGQTAHDNLAHLCEPHHRLKSLTGWKVLHLGDGRLRWTSPFGREYTTEPEERWAG